ncbi:cAMP-binding proteins - catabolite gene activator and regulatory subunit of cAMP-dependent protein kinases [Geminocystis sp. NIES-3708]|uniref:cyclic nucleotide-binding domain-containing protein n=1 Tax=Geminocystis sp. NIES-3708 TaxID=1615909 RepID=UPI0005FC3BD9|nr:cyclic nucleotide-binding domain-containing protein [Geminocystis sp. NIES-3708]BAQ62543.1 cAMP-binding proteins - catabolite gene activator and regulatory subunit of cAMP-dependent protein kinases [Geminocystis sp. NIES-3708]
MFNKTPEKTMHSVRWILTIAWFLIILSLFYDPISPLLTSPDNLGSPLRVNLDTCVAVQGNCLEKNAYYLGAPIFWGIVVPSSIFILLVFGHELWRRICPLSFLSQIPRALGWQRKIKRVSANGSVRFEIPRVDKNSWLGRNYLYLQMGWFFIGLCSRILFVNADRLALAIWLLFTIFIAIFIGYFFGGKSWCNYFCPMSPVQQIYGEPKGLFTSKAHIGDDKVTQSMCRIIEDNQEKSACIACQSPCIDIDSERSYWDSINQSDRQLLYYGYFGLVIGYFIYYYLYAGNWDYYFSGIWAYEKNQLSTLLNPGFYLFNQSIPIPKIIAVPLTLGIFTITGYYLGKNIEKFYQNKYKNKLPSELIRHRIFSILTFIIFDFFFIFAGRSWLVLLPIKVQYIWDFALVFLSSIWVYQTWGRSPEIYSKESLATRLRKQLKKLGLNISRFLEGKSLENLNTDEVYVLAKVLPGFTKDKRQEVYKGVLKESLEEGYVNTVSSLEVLEQLRSELNITDDEHRTILTELGVEDPSLLDPSKLHSVENSVRLTGYRKALERMLSLQQKASLDELLENNSQDIRKLRQEYCITYQEEEEILQGLQPESGIIARAEHILSQLEQLIERYHALNQPRFLPQGEILNLLRETVKQKKRLLVRALLEIIENSEDSSISEEITQNLANLSPGVLQDVLENSASSWYSRLQPKILNLLSQPTNKIPTCSLDIDINTIIGHLQGLLMESNPITQTISLYILAQIDLKLGREEAENLLTIKTNLLVKETAKILLNSETLNLSNFNTLEKVIYLGNANFFDGIHSNTLIELAELSYFNYYRENEIISDEGDTCRELLLLINGRVEIILPRENDTPIISSLLPGQILDELEVLSHGKQSGKIIAKTTPTKILAIAIDSFDSILEEDQEFSRRILELESSRLKQLITK